MQTPVLCKKKPGFCFYPGSSTKTIPDPLPFQFRRVSNRAGLIFNIGGVLMFVSFLLPSSIPGILFSNPSIKLLGPGIIFHRFCSPATH